MWSASSPSLEPIVARARELRWRLQEFGDFVKRQLAPGRAERIVSRLSTDTCDGMVGCMQLTCRLHDIVLILRWELQTISRTADVFRPIQTAATPPILYTLIPLLHPTPCQHRPIHASISPPFLLRTASTLSPWPHLLANIWR